MAKLINKKTGKEFNTTNPEDVLKRFPRTFRVKPATKLNNEVAQKEAIIKSENDIEVKDSQTIEPIKEYPKKDKKH